LENVVFKKAFMLKLTLVILKGREIVDRNELLLRCILLENRGFNSSPTCYMKPQTHERP
jgi:hypothetical protein